MISSWAVVGWTFQCWVSGRSAGIECGPATLLSFRLMRLIKSWPEWTSAVHVIQHPDAAGLFRHGQNEFVLRERKSDRRYPPWNHQSGTFKVRNLKRLPNGLSRGRIEVDPPDIEETASSRNKINCPAIRRPSRLIVPVLAVGNACPRATRRGHYIERGFQVR